MGLIFDTSEFIWAERRGQKVTELLRNIANTESVGISAITVAELQHGVRRATTDGQRNARIQFLDSVEDAFPVYPLSAEIAKLLGNLDAELAMRGEMLDLADLIVAATALALNYSVVTRNTKHFSRVQNLHIISPL
jgi:tRNA(fMet)-specific endonuclease VapC